MRSPKNARISDASSERVVRGSCSAASDGCRLRSPDSEELLAIQPCIEAAVCEQLVVASALDDAAGLDDHDQVGTQDGRQAVGDGDRSAALHHALDRYLDEPLGHRVER